MSLFLPYYVFSKSGEKEEVCLSWGSDLEIVCYCTKLISKKLKSHNRSVTSYNWYWKDSGNHRFFRSNISIENNIQDSYQVSNIAKIPIRNQRENRSEMSLGNLAVI